MFNPGARDSRLGAFLGPRAGCPQALQGGAFSSSEHLAPLGFLGGGRVFLQRSPRVERIEVRISWYQLFSVYFSRGTFLSILVGEPSPKKEMVNAHLAGGPSLVCGELLVFSQWVKIIKAALFFGWVSLKGNPPEEAEKKGRNPLGNWGPWGR